MIGPTGVPKCCWRGCNSLNEAENLLATRTGIFGAFDLCQPSHPTDHCQIFFFFKVRKKTENTNDSCLVTVTSCLLNSFSCPEPQQETIESIKSGPAEMSLIVDGLVNPDCRSCLGELTFSL